jgi:hypothetical protein
MAAPTRLAALERVMISYPHLATPLQARSHLQTLAPAPIPTPTVKLLLRPICESLQHCSHHHDDRCRHWMCVNQNAAHVAWSCRLSGSECRRKTSHRLNSISLRHWYACLSLDECKCRSSQSSCKALSSPCIVYSLHNPRQTLIDSVPTRLRNPLYEHIIKIFSFTWSRLLAA